MEEILLSNVKLILIYMISLSQTDKKLRFVYKHKLLYLNKIDTILNELQKIQFN